MFSNIIRRQIFRGFSRTLPQFRQFHDDFTNNPDELRKKLAPLKKFQVFQDSEQIILDVEEERQLREQQELSGEIQPLKQQRIIDMDISLERGLTGVFEIEEIVKILRKENGIDICVCKVPSELKYVDYIGVVTGRSHRHMIGMAEYIRRIFKLKRHKGDVLPRIEGANGRDWMAIDLGNIALHIFSHAARLNYDLESLWALGSQYDEACNQKEDENLGSLDKYSIYLEDLKPKTD
uniref:Mitochondrial assembly of ribosomal large subunit protein 1 n=1 Tax=Culicoides sonorensis TaxID=179676 RepID=A0A336MYU8_CULSO